MSRDISSLEVIDIASPCSASWEAMQGDEQVRHCEQCHLNVYNLSAMTKAEAFEFVSQREGRTCVRLYKRADGTVISADCPVGMAALRKKVVRMLAATVAFVVGLVFANLAFPSTRVGNSGVAAWIHGLFSERPLGPVIMGEYCPPGPPPVVPVPAAGANPAGATGAGGEVDGAEEQLERLEALRQDPSAESGP